MVYTKLSSTTILNINNKKKFSWAPNQHIRMISKGSCDTEDWSNVCWKICFDITGINGVLEYIKTENNFKL